MHDTVNTSDGPGAASLRGEHTKLQMLVLSMAAIGGAILFGLLLEYLILHAMIAQLDAAVHSFASHAL